MSKISYEEKVKAIRKIEKGEECASSVARELGISKTETLLLVAGAGLEQTFDLVASTSRGKSITINGLSAGLNIKFTYNPTANTLTITCG